MYKPSPFYIEHFYDTMVFCKLESTFFGLLSVHWLLGSPLTTVQALHLYCTLDRSLT